MRNNNLFKYKRCVILCFFCFVSIVTFSQNVIITDKNYSTEIENILNSLKVLENLSLVLESDQRGILLPQMSNSNVQEILEPKDGLIVYVNYVDENTSNILKKGLWYYDSKLKRWTKLKDLTDENELSEPPGTIVPYVGDLTLFDENNGYGKPGSDVDGWALCSLKGSFLVGALNPEITNSPPVSFEFHVNTEKGEIVPLKTDYNYLNSGGVNEYHITQNQIPTHSHNPKSFKLMNIKHNHNIGPFHHSHNLITIFNSGAGKEDHPPLQNGNKKPVDIYTTENKDASKLVFQSTPDTKITVKITLPPNSVKPYGLWNETTHDNIINKPPYVTVAYIIKLKLDQTYPGIIITKPTN